MTSTFTLTEAIREVEQGLARGERLSDVVNWVARDFALDRSLLTRRWVQFTPRAGAALGMNLPSGAAKRR